MATIRIPSDLWARTCAHLYTQHSEHFGFYLAGWTLSNGAPVFMVKDVVLIPDAMVEVSKTGWTLSTESLTAAINAAIKADCALIEIHNHGGAMPRFSQTDRTGFQDFVPYVLDSLRGRPYAATVWGDSTMYAEYFMPDGRTGVIQSVVIYGEKLDQWVSRDDDKANAEQRFDRQLPWFSEAGQRKLGRLKFGFIGLGGTGSPLAQNLVYLGARDFVFVDGDCSDETSMNRLITATAADVDTAKVVLARRLVKAVAPETAVRAIQKELQSSEVLDVLKGVDVLLGCIDNDGARAVLNEIAVAYNIPYFDLGVGIDAEKGRVGSAGGRLAVVLPGGPCLNCMGQIDPVEARYWLATEEQREFMRGQGYVRGMDIRAPSVVAPNAAVAAAAASEIAVYVSGLRPVSSLTEIDLLGVGRLLKSQWMTPIRTDKKQGCPICEMSGIGDRAEIERRYCR